jgi:hypothetical protein
MNTRAHMYLFIYDRTKYIFNDGVSGRARDFYMGAEYCCKAEEGGGLKGDLEVVKKRESRGEGRMDERHTSRL